MSHFADYYKEERGETVIENEKGFISYKIYEGNSVEEKEVMICDFYVAPEFRGGPAAKKLADQVMDVGRAEGCTHLTCFIQHTRGLDDRKRTTYKLKLYLHYGMIVHSMKEHQIILFKDLPPKGEL